MSWTIRPVPARARESEWPGITHHRHGRGAGDASRLMFFGAFPPVAQHRLRGATVLDEVGCVNALISRCSDRRTAWRVSLLLRPLCLAPFKLGLDHRQHHFVARLELQKLDKLGIGQGLDSDDPAAFLVFLVHYALRPHMPVHLLIPARCASESSRGTRRAASPSTSHGCRSCSGRWSAGR
jgi:hypothetical protein